ncbi:MAG: hypothetical protein PF482_04420, partial [Desulfobacteraceae bacterium]|nr:hypothetical protein [Desulfobacteraceae bacterium]
DTPNDMYMKNLEIYVMRKQSDIKDDFSGEFNHCKTGFIKYNYSKPFFRILCSICLIIGTFFLCWLIYERSLWVIKA